MNVLILAAGFGTRLYPLTKNIPKALLDINGKPVIEHMLAKLQPLNIDTIYILSNNRFYVNFIEWISTFQSPLAKKIKILNNGVLNEDFAKGAVGDIKHFLYLVNNEELMIVASDNIFEFDLKKMVNLSKTRKKSSVALKTIDDIDLVKRYSNVMLDQYGKLIYFQEKPQNPTTNIVSTACYFLVKEDIEKIHSHNFENKDNLGNIIQFLHKESEIYGIIYDDFWADIGTKEELERIRTRPKA